MLNNRKLKRGILAGAILVVLTLSFAQVAFFEPVTRINQFSFADQEDLPRRGNPGMAYDNESDLIVIFGGWNTTAPPSNAWKNDTWVFDYNTDTYTRKDPSIAPHGRAEPGLAYDSVRDQMVLFGGMEYFDLSLRLNDTWTYDVDTDTWTEILPASAPSARRAHDMVYDIESDRMIVFGGEDGAGLNDTWAFNAGTGVWQKMSPTSAPPARFGHRMSYDIESDRVILFGGRVFESNDFFYDTWAYDFNSDSWENLTDTVHPSARGVPSISYDSESDKLVLFGGSDSSTAHGDTWTFDYNTATWEEQSPSASPSARSRHGSAYDWESDKVIIYGGTTGSYNSNNQVSSGKTWAYDLNSNTWTEINFPPVSSTTTSTSTTTPTTPTSPPPPMLMWIAIGGIGVVVVVLVIVLAKRR
ncbi:MAG: Kelch repeat-containing protein [Candidatus Thorarchaeota archaeon]